jgi:N,N'-diacetylchitobiose transport system permease protein
MTAVIAKTAAPPTAPRTARGPRMGVRAGRIIIAVIAVIFGLIWLFPVYWMVNNSLLTSDQIFGTSPHLVPFGGSIANYARVLTDSSFWSAMRMSLTIALIVSILGIVVGFFASLALSRFRFRSRTSLIIAVLIIQMLPAEALFISQYKMLDGWGLLNSITGMTILYLGANVPFTVWMLKGFVDGVPVELEEAAMLDGCSRMGAFLRITFPLLGSGIVASSIFAFLACWNEYTLALIALTTNNSYTLPIWLAGFTSALAGTDWGGVMAGSTLMAIPVIVLFMFVQGRMATGLTAGAVK